MAYVAGGAGKSNILSDRAQLLRRGLSVAIVAVGSVLRQPGPNRVWQEEGTFDGGFLISI